MWHPLRLGIKPMSPALAGGFFTTEPPWKLPDFKTKSYHVTFLLKTLWRFLVEFRIKLKFSTIIKKSPVIMLLTTSTLSATPPLPTLQLLPLGLHGALLALDQSLCHSPWDLNQAPTRTPHTTGSSCSHHRWLLPLRPPHNQCLPWPHYLTLPPQSLHCTV